MFILYVHIICYHIYIIGHINAHIPTSPRKFGSSVVSISLCILTINY